MKAIQSPLEFSRRNFFFRSGWIATAAVGADLSPGTLKAALTKPPGDPCDGLKLGLTSYSLRHFSLEQAIAMSQAAGVKYISLKDMHLPLKSTRAQRQEVRQKIAAAGLVLMGGGVIYLKNDQEAIRQAFEYAKDAGMPTIICSPEPEALDVVEAMAKEYDVRIAIHNHGPTDKKYPSPLDVLRMVKTRDRRMGICMDVGHTVRIGQDPVPVIRQCAARLYDFHMKDVSAAVTNPNSVPVGRGVIDIVAVLKALLRIKYAGHVALEYEAQAEAPLPGITESFGYLRGVLANI